MGFSEDSAKGKTAVARKIEKLDSKVLSDISEN